LLIDHCRIGHTFFRPQNDDMERRLQLAADHHDAFIAALEARDEQAVVDLVFEHWELSGKYGDLYRAAGT
jgi:DNA-binding GntR family transcriptional regulator